MTFRKKIVKMKSTLRYVSVVLIFLSLSFNFKMTDGGINVNWIWTKQKKNVKPDLHKQFTEIFQGQKEKIYRLC